MTITNSLCRIRPWAWVAAVLGVMIAGGYARAGISDRVIYKKLPNGLQALVLENHKAPVATVNVFYQVGSRNETFGQTGISHLCEHLMFRGTKKYGPEEFSNIIAENGGEDNAFTSADYTDYFELINRDHLDIPLLNHRSFRYRPRVALRLRLAPKERAAQRNFLRRTYSHLIYERLGNPLHRARIFCASKRQSQR